MSTQAIRQVTDIHVAARPTAVVRRLLETFRLWERRISQRRELAAWGERELHDLGISWDVVAEEIKKPFWRA